MSGPLTIARHWARLVVLLAMAGWSTSAIAAPQTFNTALPVPKGEFIFRGQVLFKRASDDPSPANRDVTVVGGVSDRRWRV